MGSQSMDIAPVHARPQKGPMSPTSLRPQPSVQNVASPFNHRRSHQIRRRIPPNNISQGHPPSLIVITFHTAKNADRTVTGICPVTLFGVSLAPSFGGDPLNLLFACGRRSNRFPRLRFKTVLAHFSAHGSSVREFLP